MMGRTNFSTEETPIAAASVLPHDYESSGLVTVVTADENEAQDIPMADVATDVDFDDDYVAPKWQDLPFAISFWIHFGVMLWLGIFMAPKGFQYIDINIDAIEEEMRKSDDITEDDIRKFDTFLDKAAAYLAIYPVRILTLLVLPCCILAFFFGLIGTSVILKPCTRTMIYVCLIASFVWTAIILLGSAILTGGVFLYLLSVVSLLAVTYYVRVAWRMVPFAAINLKIALEGIGRNCGIFIVAFVFAELGFLWVVYWSYVFLGVLALQNNNCEEKHPEAKDDYDSDICNPSPCIVTFFLLSLYWTSSIIMNTMQVSVAGVMATWCLDKFQADNCCSPAILGSIKRSMTYSFGSICLGSLLQAVVAVLRYLIDSARAQRQQDPDNGSGPCDGIFFCILDCIAKLLEELLLAFNQWAFTFVGLYGYSYVESGKRVMELFRARGFTAIITNNLVYYVLGFTTFMIGLTTAATGWLIEHSISENMSSYGRSDAGPLDLPPPPLGFHFGSQTLPSGPLDHSPPLLASDPPLPPPGHMGASLPSDENSSFIFGPLPYPGLWAALIGFVIGLWVASVMVSVVKGAVNTLIVCWADSPAALETQHPELTRELATAWSNAFCFMSQQEPRFGGRASPSVII